MVLGVVGKGVLFREVSSVGGVRIQRFHCTIAIIIPGSQWWKQLWSVEDKCRFGR